MLASHTETVTIAADPARVYAFVVDPRNLPRWAPGFARAVTHTPHGWSVTTAGGTVDIRFADENEFGIADHWVTVEPGVVVYNALRVIANGAGTEVIFTFFQTPDLNDADIADVAALVAGDLRTLKALLEAGAGDVSVRT